MPQNTRLTKRQAALAKARQGITASESSQEEEDAGDVDSLPTKRRRGAVDPTELALRKEESARKRRNVSEKKLQNEKAETINRLLKKRSGPRKKKGIAPALAVGTATPIEVPTPTGGSEAGFGTVADRDLVAMDDGAVARVASGPIGSSQTTAAAATPAMYRWISTTRSPADATPPSNGEKDEDTTMLPLCAPEPKMLLSFSVPLSVQEIVSSPPPLRAPTVPALCAVEGCGKDRRYRLVGAEWGVGACGMGHLKMLEGARG
ncbi:hypothetical protein C8F01DRAFT_215497 [Mycena amicta]|nr:hypothetical protein C8F01DRAFT_215497 [Mycena amicta]